MKDKKINNPELDQEAIQTPEAEKSLKDLAQEKLSDIENKVKSVINSVYAFLDNLEKRKGLSENFDTKEIFRTLNEIAEDLESLHEEFKLDIEDILGRKMNGKRDRKKYMQQIEDKTNKLHFLVEDFEKKSIEVMKEADKKINFSAISEEAGEENEPTNIVGVEDLEEILEADSEEETSAEKINRELDEIISEPDSEDKFIKIQELMKNNEDLFDNSFFLSFKAEDEVGSLREKGLVRNEVYYKYKTDEEAVQEEIDKMPEKKKKGILEGLANLGFRTTELKSKIIGGFLGKISKGMSNEKMATFFLEYENIYKKAGEKAKNQRLTVGKGKLSRLSGLGQGVRNVVKYARVFYDLNVLNPLRHVTAASMFVGRTAEAVKETRFQSEKVKEKTRVDDIDRATEEAWAIYEKAIAENEDDKPSAEALKSEYKKQLPKDLLERLNRADGVGIGFINNILNKDIKWAVDKINKRIAKIENNKKLSSEQQEENKRMLLARNEAFLEDLDRMVADQGAIDSIAYYSRLSEKTGKAASTAMVIDSLERFSRLTPQLYELIHEKWLGEGEMTGFKGVMDTAKRFWEMKTEPSHEEYLRAGEKPASPESGPVGSIPDTREVPDGTPIPGIKSMKPPVGAGSSAEMALPGEQTEQELTALAERDAMEAVGEVKPGDSVWSMSQRYINERLNGRLSAVTQLGGADTTEAYRTYFTDELKDVITADPEEYGLPKDVPFEKLTVEQLKGLDLNKAFRDIHGDGTVGVERVLSPEQIKSIVSNNKALGDFFDKHPDAPRSVQNFDDILKGHGNTGEAPVETVPAESASLTAEEEATLKAEETKLAEIDQRMRGVVRGIQEQATTQTDAISHRICEVKWARDRQYYWDGKDGTAGSPFKDLDASQVIGSSDATNEEVFGKPFYGDLDRTEIKIRGRLIEELQGLKTASGLEPRSGETVEQFMNRANTRMLASKDSQYVDLMQERLDVESEITLVEQKVARILGFEHVVGRGLKIPGFVNSDGHQAYFSPSDGETIVGYRNENGTLKIQVYDETPTPGEFREYGVKIDGGKVLITGPNGSQHPAEGLNLEITEKTNMDLSGVSEIKEGQLINNEGNDLGRVVGHSDDFKTVTVIENGSNNRVEYTMDKTGEYKLVEGEVVRPGVAPVGEVKVPGVVSGEAGKLFKDAFSSTPNSSVQAEAVISLVEDNKITPSQFANSMVNIFDEGELTRNVGNLENLKSAAEILQNPSSYDQATVTKAAGLIKNIFQVVNKK